MQRFNLVPVFSLQFHSKHLLFHIFQNVKFWENQLKLNIPHFFKVHIGHLYIANSYLA